MALSYGKKDKPTGFQKDEEAEKGLVSLENDDEDKLDMPAINGKGPDYPYGLRISLTEKELDKLKLDAKDASVGDYVEFRARACVKSKTEHDHGEGPCCRVELQIEQMGVMKE